MPSVKFQLEVMKAVYYGYFFSLIKYVIVLGAIHLAEEKKMYNSNHTLTQVKLF